MRDEISKTTKFIFEELMRIALESLNQMPVEIRKIIQVKVRHCLGKGQKMTTGPGDDETGSCMKSTQRGY